MSSKYIAMLPTYNEADNIRELIEAILELGEEYQALVVDDDSPDGTWRIVAEMAEAMPGRVHLVHRTKERGRGSAGTAGFLRALELDADLVIEMDADWSHHPRHIPDMVQAALDEPADVVVGSRLIKGGGEVGRHAIRGVITWAANTYIRLVLGLPLRDCTSGFRVFRSEILRKMELKQLRSNGPSIVQEMLMSARIHGARFCERPILFEERRAGESTFNVRIMLAGLGAVLRFRFRRW